MSCIYEVNEMCRGVGTRGRVLSQLPFHFIPCNYVSLLQGFNGVQAARSFVL